MRCIKCGKEISGHNTYCIHCGAYAGSPVVPNSTKIEKEVNWLFVVLSVFIPIFGIIYYFVKKNENLKEAKYCLRAAIISAVSILAIILFVFILITIIFAGILGAIT